jgi:ferredoxin
VRVEVDYEKCQSAGVCESLAPHVFELRTDGMMYVLAHDLTAADEADVRDAVAACPSFALEVREGTGSSAEQS